MLCPNILLVILLAAIPLTYQRRQYYNEDEDEIRCEDNMLYRENDCNLCKCSKGELEHCSSSFCTGENYYNLKLCEPPRKWTENCNTCMCIAQYGTLCTVEACSPKKSKLIEIDEPDSTMFEDSHLPNPEPNPCPDSDEEKLFEKDSIYN